MKTNGGAALIKSLELEGVDVIFGLPGGAILPVYDPIIDSPIRHILVRHEQGAGHMAEGYAHATGRPGVAMVTSGPAATNIVTPLADAYMDSVPMVVITGQVGTAGIGLDAFQEVDTVGITRSITKHNELVTNAADIPRIIREAFHIATTGWLTSPRTSSIPPTRTPRWIGTGPIRSIFPAITRDSRAIPHSSRPRPG
jgi:acetolactate synthase-1/2/3 large subunit